MRGKWLLGMLAFAGACALGAAVSLAGVYVDPSQEFVVSAIPSQAQYAPRLWGDFVAWTVGGSGDVYAKKLNSGEVIPISVGQGGNDSVNIHGQTVVWSEYAGGSPVWSYDLTGRSKSQVTGDGERPDVSGDLVVWERNHSIMVKDMHSGSEAIIPGTGPSSGADCPAISGEVVVWAGEGILGYDIAGGAALTVSTNAWGSYPLDIHGEIVVWRDGRNGNLDIYGADISDPTNVVEFPICTNTSEQSRPMVFGDIVVWHDYRNGDQDIYGYDLATLTEFPIAVGPGNQFSPTIYESTVMWSHELAGQISIHGNTIIPEPATLALLGIGGLALIRRRR